MRARRHTEEIKVRLTEHQRKMLEGMAGINDVPVAVMARALILDRLERAAKARLMGLSVAGDTTDHARG